MALLVISGTDLNGKHYNFFIISLDFFVVNLWFVGFLDSISLYNSLVPLVLSIIYGSLVPFMVLGSLIFFDNYGYLWFVGFFDNYGFLWFVGSFYGIRVRLVALIIYGSLVSLMIV